MADKKLTDIINHEFPYTDLNAVNLDWIIEDLKELHKEIEDLKKAQIFVLVDNYDPSTKALNLSVKSQKEVET